jgi:hypothetical protein
MENWLNENEEKSEQREASMITPGIWSVLAASETRWEKRNAAISSSPIDGPPCVDKVRYNSPSCLLFLQEKWEKKKKYGGPQSRLILARAPLAGEGG